MPEFFRSLFESDFMPHGHCYLWDPAVLWLNVISDVLIAAAYFAIPFVLFSFARKRKDLTFDWVFVAFGMFIMACGATHLMSVWTIWNGTYRLEGVIKAITALASVASAVMLIPLMPKLVALPSHAQMRAINTGLADEIEKCKTAEARVHELNAELELRVSERTMELREANQRLIDVNAGLQDEIGRRHVLETQMIQLHKMETVGRLAGGIAHDFNNLLTVILGFTDLALNAPRDAVPNRRQLEEIRNAGLKAASLTQQLLAFSRKQVLEPKILNLNHTVSNIERILRRLLGEHITLITVLGVDLGLVKVDPSQTEQVLMNLAVNARDAMPNGGTLTMETANVELDADYCRGHVDAEPGAFVMLAVSDTGHGMDEQTKARIFEPFFTTKDVGRGTGLGLSTVFGIVKQSGGSIVVESEPDRGTTFKVFLPKVVGAVPLAVVTESGGRRGTETVLVCEDDEMIRGFIRTALAATGYTVLDAASAAEALQVSGLHNGQIDLLLTDIVMPGQGGRELASQLLAGLPRLKVLFMSGYTEITPGPEVHFIQKPFTSEALGKKIRDVLDRA